MSPMSKVSAGLQAIVLALVFAVGAAPMGVEAQGLVNLQKLSAPLANVTYAVGGVTIMAGGVAIGAIGVSGAPGGEFDEECARAALAKIQDRMK